MNVPDEKIFKLEFKFLKDIYPKELTELLETIQTYQKKYEELKKSFDTTKIDEIKEQIKNIKSTIASIDISLKNIDEHYKNDPMAEFTDKFAYEYEAYDYGSSRT